MTIAVTKGAGWSTGEKATAVQLTAIDVNVTNALDKRTGVTDTLKSIVTCTNADAGRIVPSTLTPADANTTYQMSQGISHIDGALAALTADRIYTLSNTGAQANDTVEVTANATWTITIKDNGGGVIAVLPPNLLAGIFAKFRHNGTAWKCASLSGLSATKKILSVLTPNIASASPMLRTGTTNGPSLGLASGISPTASTVKVTDGYLIAAGDNTGGTRGHMFGMWLDGRHLIHGKTLASVRVGMTALARVSLPSMLPAIWIERLPRTYFTSGSPTIVNATSLLNSSGWVVDTSPDVASYNLAHDLTYVPNQNTVIDLTNYIYRIAVQGDGGTNPGQIEVTTVELTFS